MRLLVLKNVTCEGPGLFEETCRARGVELDVRELSSGGGVPESPAGHDAILVLGGPMNVYEEDQHPFLGPETDLIRRAMEREIPVLGICLGSQLIARACGAAVRRGPRKEIGWHPVTLAPGAGEDPLFRHLAGVPKVFQWHGDTFDLPEGAVRLASSDLYPNQAFRVRSRTYGLQFHLEVTLDMIREWVAAYADELGAMEDGDLPGRMLAEAPVRLRDLRERAGQLFAAFLDLAEGGGVRR